MLTELVEINWNRLHLVGTRGNVNLDAQSPLMYPVQKGKKTTENCI